MCGASRDIRIVSRQLSYIWSRTLSLASPLHVLFYRIQSQSVWQSPSAILKKAARVYWVGEIKYCTIEHTQGAGENCTHAHTIFDYSGNGEGFSFLSHSRVSFFSSTLARFNFFFACMFFFSAHTEEPGRFADEKKFNYECTNEMKSGMFARIVLPIGTGAEKIK